MYKKDKRLIDNYGTVSCITHNRERRQTKIIKSIPGRQTGRHTAQLKQNTDRHQETDMKTYITDQARHRQTLRDRHENIQHSSSKTQTDRKARQLKQSPDRNKDIQSVQSETSKSYTRQTQAGG